MYSLFLDEEGYKPSSNHYVLGGCIALNEDIKEINKTITDLKKFLYSSAYIDLKKLSDPTKKTLVIEKNIKVEFDDYRLKDLLDEIFNKIDEYDFEFISTIIYKKGWYEKNFYPNDAYYIAYKSILKRYDDFLNLKDISGNMVIRINDDHLKSNLETAHGLFVKEYDEFKNIKKITDSFHFSFSYNTNLIQLAYLFVKSCFNLFEKKSNICFHKFFPYIYAKNGIVKKYGIELFPLRYLKQTLLYNYLTA